MRKTAAEIAWFTVATIGVVVVSLLLYGNVAGADAVVVWLKAGGKVLYDQLGWTLGLYVTVLLGFYAVSIGGQVLGGGAAVARARRILGVVAELMAAVTAPVVLMVAFYCVFDPPKWAVFLVLLPVVGVVLFLALQLGAFVIFDRASQIAEAERARAWARHKMTTLALRSRRRVTVVLLLNALAVAILAVLVTVPTSSIRDAVELGAITFAAVLLLLGMNALGIYLYRTGAHDPFSVAADFLPSFAVNGVGIAVGVIVVLPPGGAALGWGVFATIAATLLSSFWPRTRMNRFVLDWSVQGAASTLAARTVAKKYAKAVHEYVALTSSTANPNRLDKVREKLANALWPSGDRSGPDR